ncbi:MAG: 2-oxoglutarate dehydrogenase E1 component [Deltaproteobacteria bacterium]|nr:2-oxoglutarate dehydrogenase E1 component [Deltaproteobacteria bacterium]
MSSSLHFLDQISPDYLDALEEQYRQNPQSVSKDWAFFFDVLRLGEGREVQTEMTDSSGIVDELKVFNLINAYRSRGHLVAQVDPLGLKKLPFNPCLDLNYFKLEDVPADRLFQAAGEINLPPSTLPEIVKQLKATYCRNLGMEFEYIRDEKIYNWLKARIDKNQNRTHFTSEQKIRILQQLYRTSIFENFLQNNYTGQKRFSLEGGESLIPALKQAIDVCAEEGAQEVVIGMAHRGRLNVLANVMNKPYQEIFKEFEGAELPELEEVMGDVKYHQGFSSDMETLTGKKVHLSLAPNPSHLEFVDPVVEGIARAKQETKYDYNFSKVVPILIHGDSAVIGQGVVAETLNLSMLEGYKTGGTIHIVINNQIGFTTLPEDARSSLYCTDFGKALQCPIIHVNGDSVEDVVHAMTIASEFRMKFQRDVFIDIYCYRKYGHNEGDEPRFTQPVMYAIINKHKSPLDIYLEKLTAEPQVEQSLIDQFSQGFEKELSEKRAAVQKAPKILSADMFKGLWAGFTRPGGKDLLSPVSTEIKAADFDLVIQKIHTIPESIRPLPKFTKMIEARLERILKQDEIDWAVGEQLAFGSLMMEGFPIRLSGQDAIRGTFSHRHSAVTDNETGERYYPLNHLTANQAKFSVYDSPLSETAVVGFDYGFSCANPKTLVIWEAQFGDFGNGAQVIIDQFISSAEAKWYRMSGLTLLLPHGYEGQGPEHSSARLERYLQLCAQHNMQVAYPTTPAQFAHLLRRQMHRKFRKPLVVITPKSMLRLPEAHSKKKDFTERGFDSILWDENKPADQIKRVVMCTGKIYWELKKKADASHISDSILFVRMEQIYPINKDLLKKIHQNYGNRPWIWAQEEPQNMGAWSFMRLNTLDMQIELQYAGRPSAASPATGSHLKHVREQEQLMNEALGLTI